MFVHVVTDSTHKLKIDINESWQDHHLALTILRFRRVVCSKFSLTHRIDFDFHPTTLHDRSRSRALLIICRMQSAMMKNIAHPAKIPI